MKQKPQVGSYANPYHIPNNEKDMVNILIGGLFEIIESKSDAQTEINNHRSSFILLKLLIHSRLKDYVYEFIRKQKKVTKLTETILDYYGELEKIQDEEREKMLLYAESQNEAEDGKQAQQDQNLRDNQNNDQEDDDEANDVDFAEYYDGENNEIKKMIFHAQCINVLFYTLALICENNYDCAIAIVSNKDLISTIGQLMQVSEEKQRDRNFKKRVVKGASLLVASLTSVRESDEPKNL